MTNAITKERLTVNGEALTGSNIIVPLAQVDAVTAGLDAGWREVLGPGAAADLSE